MTIPVSEDLLKAALKIKNNFLPNHLPSIQVKHSYEAITSSSNKKISADIHLDYVSFFILELKYLFDSSLKYTKMNHTEWYKLFEPRNKIEIYSYLTDMIQ